MEAFAVKSNQLVLHPIRIVCFLIPLFTVEQKFLFSFRIFFQRMCSVLAKCRKRKKNGTFSTLKEIFASSETKRNSFADGKEKDECSHLIRFDRDFSNCFIYLSSMLFLKNTFSQNFSLRSNVNNEWPSQSVSIFSSFYFIVFFVAVYATFARLFWFSIYIL